ncbi:nonaspanin [Chloropicon primus]|nr:nonaspanin [Chloropicon primus]
MSGGRAMSGGRVAVRDASLCLAVAVTVVAALAPACEGFYLPGVAPQDFSRGDEVQPRVGRVSSAKTHIPFDYYELPLCDPAGKPKDAPANLGEILSADRYHSAPFQLAALVNETCRTMCDFPHTQKAVRLRSALIMDAYDVRIRIDNMPAMYLEAKPTRNEVTLETEIRLEAPKEIGYPLGSIRIIEGKRTMVVHNHITLWIQYHMVDSPQARGKKARIISVYVTTTTYDSSDPSTWQENCKQASSSPFQNVVAPQLASKPTRMSYSVRWVETSNRWATRWDSILQMDSYEHETNWSSLINTILLLLLLGFLVAVIILRAVKNDFAALREFEGDDMGAEDASNVVWKKLARDVFRQPRRLFLLSVLYGNGAQLLAMLGMQMFFALLGFYSPSNRGSFLTYSLIGYAFLAVVGGRAASRLYGCFPDEMNRRKLVVATATLIPGTVFGAFFLIDLVLWAKGSSGATPFLTLLFIMFLWFGVTLPLTFLGSYLGFKKPYEFPIKPARIPRLVPQKTCFMSLPVLATFAGLTLYSMMFIQVFQVVQKVWLHQFVYMFGFLFLSGTFFLVGCIEITIIAVYLTLSYEDYHWWWRAFLVPFSSGIFMFLGTSIYQAMLTNELFDNVQFVTVWMMSSYLGMSCLAVSLIAGAVGLWSSIWFTTVIYSRCKPD